jgi:hypothetical protein
VRLRPCLRHQSLSLFGFGQDGPAALVEGLAHLGHPETACRPLDQPRAQPRLQPGDPAAELRFGLAQRPPRGREPAMRDDLREIEIVVEVLHRIVPYSER